MGEGLLEISQKVREFGTVALGVISSANAIYQLIFRQDIVLLIMSAMVSGIAFYAWMNRDDPDKLKNSIVQELSSLPA